ncbi:hypothetical protein Tco_0316340 [Tanacetum coccineum]
MDPRNVKLERSQISTIPDIKSSDINFNSSSEFPPSHRSIVSKPSLLGSRPPPINTEAHDNHHILSLKSAHSSPSTILLKKALQLDKTGSLQRKGNLILPLSEESTTTWVKPIPESERPATPEPEWTIPPNDFPEPEHNWANAYATTFKVPEENKLQRKTYDIGLFIKWFRRRTGKKKLCKANLEGPAFNLEEGILNHKHCESSDREAVRSKMRILQCGQFKVKIVWETYNSGLKGIKQRFNLERPNWDAPTITQIRLYIVRKSQEHLSTETEMIKEKHRLNELSTSLVNGTIDKSLETLTKWLKTSTLFDTIRQWTRKWSEDEREEAKTSSTAIEKMIQNQKDLSKSRKLCWRKE